MPELLIVFSKKELRTAHAWARSLGLSCRTLRQRTAVRVRGAGVDGEIGVVGMRDGGGEPAVVAACDAAAGARRFFHFGRTLEEALSDLETFINKIRVNSNGE